MAMALTNAMAMCIFQYSKEKAELYLYLNPAFKNNNMSNIKKKTLGLPNGRPVNLQQIDCQMVKLLA